MTTRIYLIRHGATQLSAEDRFAGESRVPLSAEGVRQADFLARRLASQKIAAVYASPMERTMHTATVVAAPHHLDVVPKDGLREISHGRWEGMSRKEVEEKFPDEYARWESDPFSFAPREGESGLCVTARALPVLLDLVERHPADHIVVVSHKATIRLLLSSLLGFDPRRFRDRLDQSPCAINILDFKTPAHPRLVLFNDTSHYDTDAIPAIPQNRLSKVWDEK